jgi:peptidoglycan biosynthesis protein MviN/MurJ (putative lipid II flippase)
MTALRHYLIGLATTGALGIVVTRLAQPSLREEIAAGVVIGLLVQAPLGWWTLRSIGTEKFQLVWVGGMVLRLALVGLAAVVLSRQYRWEAGAFLMALVVTLLILLLVEAVTAAQEHSRSKSG